jgi:hypothetical protein
MKKFNSTYKQILKEDESLDRWNQQKIEQEETLKIIPISEIFEEYEDIGMSAEMGLQELIANVSEHIKNEVPKENQNSARIAVKQMWASLLKDWKGLEVGVGYEV